MSPKLLTFFLVLVPVVLFYGFINPVYSGAAGLVWTPEKSIPELQGLNVQYTNTFNQIALIEESVDDKKGLTKDYNLINDEIKNKINILLPDSFDPVRLRNEIVNIGNKSGIAITNLKVEEDLKNTNSKIGVYVVSFSTKARYPLFKKFIENYEKSMRLFIPDRISIQRQEKEGSGGVLSAEESEVLTINVASRVTYFKSK